MFWKKNDPDEAKQLSEEEIQRKLYGKYKPGTLGKVIKVSDDEKEKKQLVAEEAAKHDEPDLFSGISTLEIASPEEPQESVEPVSSTAAVDVPALEEIAEPEIEQDSNDEELFQLDLNKEDPQGFSIQEDKYVSFKLGFHEMLDAVRSFGIKYLFIGCAALVAVILVFNVISSHIDDTEYSDSIEYAMVDTEALSEGAAESNARESVDSREVVTVPVVRVEEVVPAVNTPAVVQSEEKYTVQICVSNDLAATEKLIGELADKDYSAFYRKTRTRSGKELFFVFVGRFATRDDANAALKAYRGSSALKKYDDSFVTNIKKD